MTDIEADALRTQYQRKAAVALSSCPKLSQYFSLAALDGSRLREVPILSSSKNDGSSVNTSKSPRSASSPKRTSSPFLPPKPNAPESNDVFVGGNDFICPCCGLLLSPGHCNTTVRLRTLKRGRTRRRRASRKKKASLLQQQQLSTTDQRKWNQPTADQALRKTHTIRQRQLRSVGDGMAYNCIVYTCGMCRTKVKYKGFDASRDVVQRQEPTTPAMKSASVLKPRLSFASRGKEPTTMTPASVPKPRRSFVPRCKSGDEDDFMPLDRTTPREEEPAIAMSPSFVSPLVPRKRNRKRKSDSGKKPKLMEFLSSLND